MTRATTELAVLFLAVSCLGSAGAEPPKIEVGEPFPDLVLPRLADGAPASLADFRGEKVILEIFASW